MKKQIYLLVLSSIFLLLPNLTYADCTEEEIEYFKDIEDEYKVTYEFNRETEDYTIKIYNAEPSSFVFAPFAPEDYNFEDKCSDLEKEIVECKNMAANEYSFLVISTNESCNYGFKVIELNLSYINQYWNDPMCDGIEEFVLCQPTYDKELNYEDFKSRITTYKNTKIKKAGQKETNKDNNNIKIVEYISNNYQIVLIIVSSIIAVLLIIILVAKKIKKSRRLE